jgi:hypothetical protein
MTMLVPTGPVPLDHSLCRYERLPRVASTELRVRLHDAAKVYVGNIIMRHPRLQVTIIDPTSMTPSWVQLQSLNLTQLDNGDISQNMTILKSRSARWPFPRPLYQAAGLEYDHHSARERSYHGSPVHLDIGITPGFTETPSRCATSTQRGIRADGVGWVRYGFVIQAR